MELNTLLGQGTSSHAILNPSHQPQLRAEEVQTDILTATAFTQAHRAITAWPGYAPTPLHSLPHLAQSADLGAIFYKDEGSRFGLGSFKALGGAYAVLRLLAREIAHDIGQTVSLEAVIAGTYPAQSAKLTVCCATDGNHGRSVAWGAQTFGCNCVIFIHETVSEGRKQAIEAYGARVIRCAGNYDDSVREAARMAAAEGWFVVSDTSYPGYRETPKDVMQGYEVMAFEAAERLPEPPTHVFLQTGVGGAAAAVAAQLLRFYGPEKAPKIILADPQKAACFYESFKVDQPVAVTGALDTVMAGLACGEVSDLAWEILHKQAFGVVTVSDEDAVAMMGQLARPEGGDPQIIAGESAVAGLCAALCLARSQEARRLFGLDQHARILCFGTEGATDPALYRTLTGIDPQTGAELELQPC